MIIKNKIESMEVIKKLKLNVLPIQYFERYYEEEIKEFMAKYPAKYYAVRIANCAMSNKHRLSVPQDELLEYCKNLTKFTINVSSFCYKENQIICGEIKIYKDMKIEYIVSNNSNYSVRDCYSDPDFSGQTDIYDKKIKNIKGFDTIIDYIFKYNLFDTIVEFTVFNCDVGLNNEKVVIYELRTDY